MRIFFKPISSVNKQFGKWYFIYLIQIRNCICHEWNMKCEVSSFELIHFIQFDMNGLWGLNFRNLQNSIYVNAMKLIWLNAVCNFQNLFWIFLLNLFFIFDVFFQKSNANTFVTGFNITNWLIWKEKINLIRSSILAVDGMNDLSLNNKNQSIFIFWSICLQMMLWSFKIIENWKFW